MDVTRELEFVKLLEARTAVDEADAAPEVKVVNPEEPFPGSHEPDPELVSVAVAGQTVVDVYTVSVTFPTEQSGIVRSQELIVWVVVTKTVRVIHSVGSGVGQTVVVNRTVIVGFPRFSSPLFECDEETAQLRRSKATVPRIETKRLAKYAYPAGIPVPLKTGVLSQTPVAAQSSTICPAFMKADKLFGRVNSVPFAKVPLTPGPWLRIPTNLLRNGNIILDGRSPPGPIPK